MSQAGATVAAAGKTGGAQCLGVGLVVEQNLRHNVSVVTRFNRPTVRRSPLPLTDDDLADLARLRTAGPERDALAQLAPDELPDGQLTESALLHAVFEAGLRAIREAAEEQGYAELAASESTAEAAEHRSILRRRASAAED